MVGPFIKQVSSGQGRPVNKAAYWDFNVNRWVGPSWPINGLF